MKIKKLPIVIFTLALLGMSAPSSGQLAINSPSYTNAIGLRAGGTSGLTYKHLWGSAAFEGILGLWNRGFSITGLYEKYANAGLPGLNWYYGGGAHFATYGANYVYRDRDRYFYYYRENGIALGIDGIIGIEYKIPPIPFAISLDLKPLIEVNDNGNIFGGLDPGLGIKVAF